MKKDKLPVAIRAFAAPGKLRKKRTTKIEDLEDHECEVDLEDRWGDSVLVFDTETTTDETQRLLFGSYRYHRWNSHGLLECVEEGIFYGDDLPERDPTGYETLKRFAETHDADVVEGQRKRIRFMSRRDFVDKRLWKVLQASSLIVGFNLPFDFTRLAVGCGEAQGPMYYGGFSLTLWQYRDKKTGEWKENPYRPRLLLKLLDSKRAFMGLTTQTRLPKPEKLEAKHRHGRFLDLRTLTFALTASGMSLRTAGERFQIDHPKISVEEHGVISEESIEYNRRDVLATAELLEKLREEYDKHPVTLAPEYAYSPASIAKAYLGAMGVEPPAQKFSVGHKLFGRVMATYYGGRSEVRIRKTEVPVVYCDFASMYPTVNVLMGLWNMFTAENVEVVDVKDEIQNLLEDVTLEDCFQMDFWKKLTFFAYITPNDDILPHRAQYDQATKVPSIGVNRVTSRRGIWYAGPDLVASKLLSGKVPQVRKAFRIVSKGKQENLAPVSMCGVVIDPRHEDFFKRLVEIRKSLNQLANLSDHDAEWLKGALKVIANAGGYGVMAEMNRRELPKDQPKAIKAYGLDGQFNCRTSAPELLGRYCFPPMAALITSGARLMLALLERCVSDCGGQYAFCDTDSMAIVATKRGGLVPCNGGDRLKRDGTEAIRALSWEQVAGIIDKFAAINPYDRSKVPGSILEIEDENFDEQGRRHQLLIYAISAKRYVMYTRGRSGAAVIEKPSEHGLGHLLDPTHRGPVSLDEPEMEEGWHRTWPMWIGKVWKWTLDRVGDDGAKGQPWFSKPAVSRITVSSPDIHRSFKIAHPDSSYERSVKPMNFVLSVPTAAFGHPDGADPENFHLIAGFNQDSDEWLKTEWINKYTGERFPICIDNVPPPHKAAVVSIGDMLQRFVVHPEAKSADAIGQACKRDTVGLLRRRVVQFGRIKYIGKESNRLGEAIHGMVKNVDEVRNTYDDPKLDPWFTDFVPFLRCVPAERLAKVLGVSPRTIKAYRNSPSRPRLRRLGRIVRALKKEAQRVVRSKNARPDAVRDAEALLDSPLLGELGI